MSLGSPWSLAGPHLFVENVVDIAETKIVLIHAASAPPGLSRALRNEIEDRYDLRAHYVAGELFSHSPAAVIADGYSAAPDSETPKKLAQNRALDGHIVIVDSIPHENWAAWRALIYELANSRDRNQALSAIFIVPEGVTVETLPVKVVIWEKCLSHLDVMMWANSHIPAKLSQREALLLEATSVEIGGWEFHLVEKIAKLSLETLFDPMSFLLGEISPAPSQSCDVWRGEDFRSSISLAHEGDKATLSHRLWRAHLQALFPWIENLRLEIVERHASSLRGPWQMPWGDSVNDPFDLEAGSLAQLLKNQIDLNELKMLRNIAAIRNQIAHRKPAKWADYCALEASFGRR
jgi:hypothetical protein